LVAHFHGSDADDIGICLKSLGKSHFTRDASIRRPIYFIFHFSGHNPPGKAPITNREAQKALFVFFLR
jgi:hypothetical protein